MIATDMRNERKKRRYSLSKIEKEAQAFWREHKVFEAEIDPKKKKKYILDMFPYPSGALLHVGHLLGYYASDVMAIYARMQGYAVLHPMGFDAFGLPAEQHAIETGEHPAVSVKKHIKNYKQLLKRVGLSFDWRRSFSTTAPSYYRWTQWIFLQLFDSWYNKETDRAERIGTLVAIFEKAGNNTAATAGYKHARFTAAEWCSMSPEKQQKVLGCYRLAYVAAQYVNWCPALGTVLANDEVKDGRSERGGHVVERKKMMQWCLRMRPYADRLLSGLEQLDWPSSIKEVQRHWIGKSKGVEVVFASAEKALGSVHVFTTRLETIFGVTFVALAPEHPLVEKIVRFQEAAIEKSNNPSTISPETDLMLGMEVMNAVPESPSKLWLKRLKAYLAHAKNIAVRARVMEAGPSGVFTGCYAVHPLTGKKVPIFVAAYVLMDYGLGAVMGVPAHDERDYAFAKQFNLPVVQVIGGGDKIPYEGKEGKMVNAGSLNGLSVGRAYEQLLSLLSAKGQARRSTQYRLHDPVFARQRYWGEPVPIYFKEGLPCPLPEKKLPLRLPQVDSYKPTQDGAAPLARAAQWEVDGWPLETSTMPSWAGSSWYFLRYMDPKNRRALAGLKALNYWQAVDVYVGGKEHATGHLIYARFFTKFLYDRGYVPMEEPFSRLFNQGMIQSFSQLVYRIKGTNKFVSHGLRKGYTTTALRVAIDLVKKRRLDVEAFKKWRPDLANATFILEDGEYICGALLEKMSKSKYNTISPAPIIKKYGADVLRLYMLFLGPIQQDKPWSVEGIQGIARFIKRVFAFFDRYLCSKIEGKGPSDAMLSALHEAIYRVERGVDRFAFNTSISALMVLINRLQHDLAHIPNRAMMEDVVRLLAPFAPHIAEYLWRRLGRKKSVMYAGFPTYNPAYMEAKNVMYPIAVNGKRRAEMSCSIDDDEHAVTQRALQHMNIQRWIKGKQVKKVIFVHKRMVNIVL